MSLIDLFLFLFYKERVYSGSHNAVHVWETEEPFGAADKLEHSHGSVYSLAATKEYLILGK